MEQARNLLPGRRRGSVISYYGQIGAAAFIILAAAPNALLLQLFHS